MKRRALAVCGAIAALSFATAVPASANYGSNAFPDGCNVYWDGWWSGSYPYASTEEKFGCYQMRAGINYKRAHDGAWVTQESIWSTVSVGRYADVPASDYGYSIHRGDAKPSDCCFYTITRDQ